MRVAHTRSVDHHDVRRAGRGTDPVGEPLDAGRVALGQRRDDLWDGGGSGRDGERTLLVLGVQASAQRVGPQDEADRPGEQ